MKPWLIVVLPRLPTNRFNECKFNRYYLPFIFKAKGLAVRFATQGLVFSHGLFKPLPLQQATAGLWLLAAHGQPPVPLHWNTSQLDAALVRGHLHLVARLSFPGNRPILPRLYWYCYHSAARFSLRGDDYVIAARQCLPALPPALWPVSQNVLGSWAQDTYLKMHLWQEGCTPSCDWVRHKSPV